MEEPGIWRQAEACVHPSGDHRSADADSESEKAPLYQIGFAKRTKFPPTSTGKGHSFSASTSFLFALQRRDMEASGEPKIPSGTTGDNNKSPHSLSAPRGPANMSVPAVAVIFPVTWTTEI